MVTISQIFSVVVLVPQKIKRESYKRTKTAGVFTVAEIAPPMK